MAGNSNDRKKALIISVLLFLMTGGGVFLFFVVQGSNDLIGKGKEFSYGGAAREGVSSFFKYLGGTTPEEELLAKKDEIMVEKREELVAAAAAANPDVSDWMQSSPKPSASASPTAVPRMGGGGLSGAGGIGGGGSKSAGGVSRFGEGSGLGNTRVGAAASNTGTTEKGTMGALNRAKNSLGEGLRSGSASTARAKWGSGFGDGSGKGGQMSYTSGGLVKLDTIKKGEVANLKMAYAKKPSVPDATDFQRDEKAESKDAGLQAAKAEAQKNAEAEAKKAAAQAALQAASNSMSGTGSTGNQRSNDRSSGSGGGGDVPDTIQNTAKNAIFSSTQLAGGQMSAQDSTISYSRNSDGTYTATFSGTGTIAATGKTFPYVQEAKISSTGEILGWSNK